jgi:hypothetical protein
MSLTEDGATSESTLYPERQAWYAEAGINQPLPKLGFYPGPGPLMPRFPTCKRCKSDIAVDEGLCVDCERRSRFRGRP